MIQHDIMLFDHGMPRPDGTISPEQRPEADVNIEFQVTSKTAAESMKLAWIFEVANEHLCDRLPGDGRQPHDQHRLGSVPGSGAVDQPARERARAQIGSGWDPQWHQPTDVFTTLHGQGLSARSQRRPDNARRGCDADQRHAEETVGARMRRVVLMLLAVIATITFVEAQTEKLDYATIGRIRDEGLNRSQVMDHVSWLSDVYGPRLTGSPAIMQASDWVIKKVTEWGLTNAHREPWKFGKGWSLVRFPRTSSSRRSSR